MPPEPPVRTTAGPYHFHVYDYDHSQPFTLSPGQPKRNGWGFYSMAEDLDGLAYEGVLRHVPNISIQDLGVATSGGRRTKCLSFGNPANVPGLPTIVITGGIHAREWAATEMTYLLAEYLIVNYNAAPVTAKQATLRNLIHTRNIHIIPMLNPDGNWFTVFGTGGMDARLWRKNRRPLPKKGRDWVTELTGVAGVNPPFHNVQNPLIGRADYEVPDYDADNNIPPNAAVYRKRDLDTSEIGVDLNRNASTLAFGYDCKPNYNQYDPSSETYFGPKKGGEIETQNLEGYALTLGPVAASIDYHAFGQLILYPGETGSAARAGSGDFIQLGQVLHALIKTPGNQFYRLGTPLDLVEYDGTGAVSDYLTQQNQSRGFTIEVDPANDPPPDPFWRGFTPAESAILPMFQANIRGALALIDAPLPIAGPADVLGRRQSMTASAATFLAWNGVYALGNQLPA